MKRTIALFLALVFLPGLITGCTSIKDQQIELIVSAAASLKDVMEELQPIYSRQNAEVVITYNFGGSGALQQQIEQGAPVDLFISAAASNMEALAEKDLLVADSKKNLLQNKLVLIAPAGNTGVTDFNSLADAQVSKIALGEPASVPAGQYAKEILTNLSVWDKVEGKIVFAKDVRQVLNYVETGNVDAGVVYLTDAKSSDKVKIIAEAPPGSHTPVVYPLAIIKTSKNQEAAQDYAAFLAGDEARAVFEKYGFTLIE